MISLMVNVLERYTMRALIVVCVRGYREKDVRDGNGDCVNDGSSTLPR